MAASLSELLLVLLQWAVLVSAFIHRQLRELWGSALSLRADALTGITSAIPQSVLKHMASFADMLGLKKWEVRGLGQPPPPPTVVAVIAAGGGDDLSIGPYLHLLQW